MTQTDRVGIPTNTDHQIQTAVVKELDWSPGVESAHIGVAVTNGAVTLSGEVMTLSERTAAVAAATRIHCVVALVDQIVVRQPTGSRPDADIARDANSILRHHGELAGAPVTATVHHHVVTLSGQVDWQYQRRAAHVAMRSIAGVVQVDDLVTVVAHAVQADAADAIRAALVRGATNDAEHIAVTVVDHTATLRGRVNSWKERREAENAAYRVRGVTHVDNELVIVP